MQYEQKVCPTCDGERFLRVTKTHSMLCPRCGGDGALLVPVISAAEWLTSPAVDKILKDIKNGGANVAQ